MKNWFNSYGIRARIIGLMCLLILPLIILIQGYILPSFEARFYQNKKDTTRITVEVAMGVIDSIYADFKSGKIKEDEAKQKALESIGSLRYNKNEYYWINDFSPKMIMHPMKPDLIGKSLSEMTDPTGKFLFNEMVAVVKKDSAGFVEYMWSKPNSETPVKKISYVKEFKPWGWIIGNGVYVDDVAAEMKVILVRIWSVLAFTIIIAGFMVVTFSSYLTKKLLQISEMVLESTQVFKLNSENITISSENISRTTTSSAAALQETSSSLEEISCMIKKSSDNSDELYKLTANSKVNVANGKQSVEEMLNTMKGIIENNNKISDQVHNSNKEMEDIINMIKEISNKTKVINDIVFQTKLLSFNASVEAARAGEHGKGFAVVAEEIGNLAEMSGNSAKEIGIILQHSTTRVQDIVERNRSGISLLVENASANLKKGLYNANQCEKSLDQIVSDSDQVNFMVNEIATAFKEQASGVREITNAMGELDVVTQQNASSAKENSQSAEELHRDATRMESVTYELVEVVNGKAKVQYSETA